MPPIPVELPLAVDRAAPASLTVQLGDRLREAIRGGALAPGERLPSTRALARQLAVSRTVVTDAYQQLYAEGWIEGRHGSGTYVADLGPSWRAAPAGPAVPGGRGAAGRADGPARDRPGGSGVAGASGAASAAGAEDRCGTAPPDGGSRTAGRRDGRGRTGPDGRAVIDLRPGRPWVRDYDEAAWRRAWRAAADLPPGDEPDPYGLPRLREELARHLRRARTVPAGPENIMVTRGTGNGLDLVAATVLRPGDRVGVEDPGWSRARTILAGRGAEIVPCPVDADGVIVEELPADLRLLYTTPAHQYPLGGRLPVARRERLLAWARRSGALVVEDDYDAEFRYDVAPLPALYGLDPARVVLLGTLSKSLSPDIGVGWLVAAPDLLAAVARTRRELTDRTSGPAQQAVAVLLERGDLDRHLRRMRRQYARRRAALVAALGSRVTGDTAGLHVMIELPGHEAGPLVEAARARGVLLDSTGRHHHGPPGRHGLVIGYGSASLAQVRQGAAILAHLLGTGLAETAE
ncbi:PLP-dependent aminotransferase family protein [Planomonospora corallina]|uniref:PLP-dependent aminotransferase family protein n=1 Tax=Planomonospora corallina TaxID=1806052 RepID=A0ABV8I8I0_9ACTN